MCMIDDFDGGCEFSNSCIRIARKEHRCCECDRAIAAGEKYVYAVGKQDGDFWTVHQCEHCSAAAKLLMRECHGFFYGGVLEDLEEHIHESLPWSMQAARLVVAMRHKWRRFRSVGMMPLPIVAMPEPRP